MTPIPPTDRKAHVFYKASICKRLMNSCTNELHANVIHFRLIYQSSKVYLTHSNVNSYWEKKSIIAVLVLY